jgi:succinate-acetate transporter protein
VQTSSTKPQPGEVPATHRPDDKVQPAVPRAGAAAGPVDTQGPHRINTVPLCLIAFAVVTFMFSLINAGGASHAVVPIVISTGLIFAGFTQLIGGLIQISNGDTLNGAMFSTFASLWILLSAYLEWFSKAVPIAQRGQATSLVFYTFAIVAATFLLVSLRTNVATLIALGTLVITLVLLAAGNGSGHSAPVRAGGVTGIILAAQALYLAAAELCQFVYGRTVIPLGQLGAK